MPILWLTCSGYDGILRKLWLSNRFNNSIDTTSKLSFPDGPDAKKWIAIAKKLGLPAEFEQLDTAVKHPFAGIKVVIDFGNGSGWRTGSVYSDLGA